MATAKSLQKPKIIEIIGSTIRVAHPDISGNARTTLASPILASGIAMSVLDNHDFADNDWFIVGEVGDNETEENDVNGAVTRGKSLTVTNTLKFDHELDAPVTKIYERQVRIYGAATDGGSLTLIATLDIQWDKKHTEYTLVTTDTAYAYYAVKFYDKTTESSASDYVASTGLTASTVEEMIQRALRLSNSELTEKITREICVKWANECQEEITQFTYDDVRTGRTQQMNWDFEIDYDESITLTQNENKYDISGLGMKFPNTSQGMISLRLGDSDPLRKITIRDLDEALQNRPRTELSVQALAGDTTLTVDSNAEFADSGNVQIGSDTITYTGKSGLTGFTGVPASGSGAITTTHAVDAAVWQNIGQSLPEKYVIHKGYLYLDRPVYEDDVGIAVKIRFFKALTALAEASDTTEVTFTNVFPIFIASRIQNLKGNDEKSEKLMAQFEKILLKNAHQNDIPHADPYEYYRYQDPIYDISTTESIRWT